MNHPLRTLLRELFVDPILQATADPAERLQTPPKREVRNSVAQMPIVVANPAGVFHRVCSNRGRTSREASILECPQATGSSYIDAATRYRNAFGTHE